MPTNTIAGQLLKLNEARDLFAVIKTKLDPTFNWSPLDSVFEIALQAPSLFPKINLGIENHGASAYITHWASRYYRAYINPPSSRKATQGSSCPDPASIKLVAYKLRISPQDIIWPLYHHNLFMAAENIQGGLLEEYIAQKITPYGFIWCLGNVLHAVDFCNREGTFLLQVKNKYNTENSSSSNIREGTPIKKWHRLAVRTTAGNKTPVYQWDELNQLINSYLHNLPHCYMSEDEYISFLMHSIERNPNIITV